MANEGINGRTGAVGGWPDNVDDRILYELAVYHGELRRSLRAAAFGWVDAGSAARAAYLDGLAELREKEKRVWAAYLARPVNETKGTP